MTSISITNEFSKLQQVIIGRGSPYLQDKELVADEIVQFPFIPNTDRKEEVLALNYPTEEQLIEEYKDYVAILEKYDVDVLFADSTAAYSFDYTCPRDIGFVIGDEFLSPICQSRAELKKLKRLNIICKKLTPLKYIAHPMTVY